MKKRSILLGAVMAGCMMSSMTVSAGIDISVFESNAELYEVEIDDFDDTGNISLIADDIDSLLGNVWAYFKDDMYMSDELYPTFDIRIVDDGELAIPRLALYYEGEDWIFIDKVILKGYDERFTFEVDPSTDTDNGKVYEYVTVVLGSEGVRLFEDIKQAYEDNKVNYADLKEEDLEQYESIVSDVHLIGRLSGSDGERDFSLVIDRADKVVQMYEDFVAAGGLEQDFSAIDELFPCEIKEMSN